MRLAELEKYVENITDEIIAKSMLKDNSDTLNKFIVNTLCDLLKGVNLADEYKITSLDNIINYNNKDIGEIATYITITPYVQKSLKNHSDYEIKATYFLEVLISYIVGLIDKNTFIENLTQMKDILELSDKFYNGLVIYFSTHKEYITNKILDKLK